MKADPRGHLHSAHGGNIRWRNDSTKFIEMFQLTPEMCELPDCPDQKQDLGPHDVVLPGAVSERVVPFTYMGEPIGTARVNSDGTVEITIDDGPRAETIKQFLIGDGFEHFTTSIHISRED